MKDHTHLQKQSCRRTYPAHLRVVACLLALLIAAPQLLSAAVQPQLPNPGLVAPREQQVKLGLQAVGEVYKQMPVLPDSSPVTQYVQQLGRRLVTVIPQQSSWPYQFHVVQQKDINAFALPGGPIFINLGTITAASNEAELAGVMAHEMSHVYMQHSMKQAKKEALPGALASILSGVLGSYGGAVGSLASLGIRIGAGAVFMKYSREDEAQADAVGAIIMYKAGYDPQAMASFFQKLEKMSGGSGGPQFLSDHPNPGNRYAAITQEIKNWPPKSWVQNSAEFQQAKAKADGVRAYSAQEIEQGAKTGQWSRQNQQLGSTPKNLPAAESAPQDSAGPMSPVDVSVSDQYQTLRHQAFTVQYPDNWQAMGNPQSSVTIAPQGGVSQNAVAYGVMIDGFQAQNPNASLQQQTQELISQIQQQNPGIRMVGNPQNITVNGKRGRSVDLIGSSPIENGSGQPLQERDWLVTVPRSNGSLLYLVFIAPERDFNRLRPVFENMLRSLRLE